MAEKRGASIATTFRAIAMVMTVVWSGLVWPCVEGALPSKLRLDNSAPMLNLIHFPGSEEILDIGERLLMRDRQLFEEIYRQCKNNILRALKTLEQEQLAELRNNTLSVMPTEKEIQEFMDINSMVDSLAAPPTPPTGEELLKLAPPKGEQIGKAPAKPAKKT